MPTSGRVAPTIHEQQFERQCAWSAALFWAHPVVRVACGMMAILWGAMAVGGLAELLWFGPLAIDRSTFSTIYFYFAVGAMALVCARVAWSGRLPMGARDPLRSGDA